MGDRDEVVPSPTGELELEEAISALDPDRRSAFVLTQVARARAYAEAAEVCEVPVGTIRSRVARARGDLLDALAGEDSDRETGSDL